MKAVSAASPTSVEDLLARASSLAGRSLGELADDLGSHAPDGLRNAKGWPGHLVEAALGATPSATGVDFPRLGVELKTIPLHADGRPRESTWVCVLPSRVERDWAGSLVRRKLAHVLWVPIGPAPTVAARRLGAAVAWRPSPEEEEVLRADWEALTELVLLGPPGAISARVGRALQLRPKAAHRGDLAWTLDEAGEWVRDVARGFYLRRSFTRRVLGAASEPPRGAAAAAGGTP